MVVAMYEGNRKTGEKTRCIKPSIATGDSCVACKRGNVLEGNR